MFLSGTRRLISYHNGKQKVHVIYDGLYRIYDDFNTLKGDLLAYKNDFNGKNDFPNMACFITDECFKEVEKKERYLKLKEVFDDEC